MQNHFAIGFRTRLISRVKIDNRQTFVAEEVIAYYFNSGPIGPTVAQPDRCPMTVTKAQLFILSVILPRDENRYTLPTRGKTASVPLRFAEKGKYK
uniref:Uncharacterized protein n=1 Tax=Romanomermis culicivorax TaxID=13658 RepID=A0A915J0G0_ROMCU